MVLLQTMVEINSHAKNEVVLFKQMGNNTSRCAVHLKVLFIIIIIISMSCDEYHMILSSDYHKNCCLHVCLSLSQQNGNELKVVAQHNY